MNDLNVKVILLAFSLTIAGLMLAFRTQLMAARVQVAATALHYVATMGRP